MRQLIVLYGNGDQRDLDRILHSYPTRRSYDLNDNMKRTLPIAISGFFGQHQFTQWGYVFALSVLSLIPILLVFVFCQKFFVAGLTQGGVKG